mmetsp:Transcript_15245/g.17667  ORF Transcript_15245/g.17667 Transcript_15245/m.17667 type:complete len:89 (+) Transcript_15245:1165-1431(+)
MSTKTDHNLHTPHNNYEYMLQYKTNDCYDYDDDDTIIQRIYSRQVKSKKSTSQHKTEINKSIYKKESNKCMNRRYITNVHVPNEYIKN